MNNKVFGLTFAAVLSSGLLVFGASNAGAYAVDTWLFPAEEFGDNTYIGTTDVSNMEVEQAKGLFAGQSDIWRAASSLQVSYQDAVADYPIETIEILVDETLMNAENGVQNGFRFQLSPDTTAAFLAEHFPVASFSEADVNTVNAKLAAALSAGQSQTLVTISDETLAVERKVIASASFTHTIKSAEGSAVASALDGFVIEPGMKFSFLDFITALPLVEITDGELSQIASAIYSAVLQSNLTVDERSIGSAAPVSVPLGKEAAINRQLGIDLVFANPNESSVTLNVSLDSSAVKAELSGLPLVYDYEIQTGAEEKVEPRLIKQYSSFVASGSVVKKKGATACALMCCAPS
ncbi:VanW family protein [Planococcus koreensis]|uniref:VanW family protein n=1 Tax=Planococcus koreensis TaxID=112331 RepID=UPI0039FC1270